MFILENVIARNLVAFYGIRRFITLFPRSATVPCPERDESGSYYLILFLSSQLRLSLPNGPFLSSFPTKVLYLTLFL